MKELVNIQNNLKVPKDQLNKFGNYKYRSCEDILEAVKPLLADNNCSLTITDSVEFIGNKIYIKATATMFNATGETVQTNAFAREPENVKGMSDSQITGSTSSYARKYALNGLFCIDDQKDADAQENAPRASVTVSEQIKQATSYDKLKEIWKNNPDIQKDTKVFNLFKARKAEITNA